MKPVWILICLVFALVSACGPSSGSENEYSSGGGDVLVEETDEYVDDDPISEDHTLDPNDYSGGEATAEAVIEDEPTIAYISIPAENREAPAGILEQLTWAPTGGGEGDDLTCLEADCWLEYQEDGILALHDFEPNQKVALLFYRSTGHDACQYGHADYAAGYYIDVDSNGNRQVSISNDSGGFLFAVVDADTWQPLYWDYGLKLITTPC